MKVNKNFVLQEIADEFIVVPVGKEANRLNGVFSLNETGAMLWKLLDQEDHTADDLVKSLLESFSIDSATARKDVESFINDMKNFGCLNE